MFVGSLILYVFLQARDVGKPCRHITLRMHFDEKITAVGATRCWRWGELGGSSRNHRSILLEITLCLSLRSPPPVAHSSQRSVACGFGYGGGGAATFCAAARWSSAARYGGTRRTACSC